jgi:hypothetical protein
MADISANRGLIMAWLLGEYDEDELTRRIGPIDTYIETHSRHIDRIDFVKIINCFIYVHKSISEMKIRVIKLLCYGYDSTRLMNTFITWNNASGLIALANIEKDKLSYPYYAIMRDLKLFCELFEHINKYKPFNFRYEPFPHSADSVKMIQFIGQFNRNFLDGNIDSVIFAFNTCSSIEHDLLLWPNIPMEMHSHLAVLREFRQFFRRCEKQIKISDITSKQKYNVISCIMDSGIGILSLNGKDLGIVHSHTKICASIDFILKYNGDHNYCHKLLTVDLDDNIRYDRCVKNNICMVCEQHLTEQLAARDMAQQLWLLWRLSRTNKKNLLWRIFQSLICDEFGKMAIIDVFETYDKHCMKDSADLISRCYKDIELLESRPLMPMYSSHIDMCKNRIANPFFAADWQNVIWDVMAILK